MTQRGDRLAFGLQPLTPYFEHVLMMEIRWTSGLSHQRVSIEGRAFDVCRATTCPAKVRTVWNIVPHGRERRESRVYKVGHGNAFALPPQYSHQGPRTRGAFTRRPSCHVAPHTGVCMDPCGPAWPPATCPRPMRHLRLGWAIRSPATWPQCHVASAQWSCAPSQFAQ